MQTKNKIIFNIVFTSVMTACGYVVTIFLPIPYANGAGYLNFGDIFSIISCAFIGPFSGAFVGIVSGSLADLTLGGVQYIPFTIVGKGLMCLFIGFTYSHFNKYVKLLAILLGELISVFVYFICYWIYFGLGAYMSSLFDLIQALCCSVVGYILILTINKISIFHNHQNNSNG